MKWGSSAIRARIITIPWHVGQEHVKHAFLTFSLKPQWMQILSDQFRSIALACHQAVDVNVVDSPAASGTHDPVAAAIGLIGKQLGVDSVALTKLVADSQWYHYILRHKALL